MLQFEGTQGQRGGAGGLLVRARVPVSRFLIIYLTVLFRGQMG